MESVGRGHVAITLNTHGFGPRFQGDWCLARRVGQGRCLGLAAGRADADQRAFDQMIVAGPANRDVEPRGEASRVPRCRARISL